MPDDKRATMREEIRAVVREELAEQLAEQRITPAERIRRGLEDGRRERENGEGGDDE
jgi:hypothetical protein